jgi:hypothetical protein
VRREASFFLTHEAMTRGRRAEQLLLAAWQVPILMPSGQSTSEGVQTSQRGPLRRHFRTSRWHGVPSFPFSDRHPLDRDLVPR